MDEPTAWAGTFGAVRARSPAGLRAWVRGLDPPIYVVGLMPPLVGAAATLSSPHPLPLAAAAVATGAFLLLHAAVNLYNDAFDAATPADRLKRHSLARLASVRALHLAASCLLAVACAAGIALWTAVGGWAVFALSAAGVLLVFAYHAPPLRLSHRGWGEAVTFLGFGVVPVWTVAALADGT
ncbi:MAG: prenyltransferase, partial [Thermoplasmatota archaeon]